MDLQSAAKLPFNLKILQADDKGVPKLGVPFLAMFNPDTLAITEVVDWNILTPPGNQGAVVESIRTKARTFSIDILLDGTGVNTNGVKIPVTAQIALFRFCTTDIVGTEHRPNHLLLQYGLIIVHCVLLSSTVTYTMFDPLGLPIRAKISASFTEVTPTGYQAVLAMLSSPDLTHKITVHEGDLLPLLTHQVYKNQNYYLQVAKANKLKNFRKLKTGSTLIFPPISKTKKV
jgi:Contractile injection system tube protein